MAGRRGEPVTRTKGLEKGPGYKGCKLFIGGGKGEGRGERLDGRQVKNFKEGSICIKSKKRLGSIT